MRRSTRLGLIAATVLLVVGIGAYSAFWLVGAGRIKDQLPVWADALRARGVEASWQAVRVDGYPFAFRLELSEVRFSDKTRSPPAVVSAPVLAATVPSWAFRTFRLAAPAGLSAVFGDTAAPLAQIDAKAATGAVSIAADGSATIWVTLHQATAEMPTAAAESHVAAVVANGWAIIPSQPPGSDTEPNLAVAADLHELSVPTPPVAFGNVVDDLAVGLTLMGPFPAGSLPQALEAWRRAGGTLELDGFHLRWGSLAVAASGTLALDPELQPIGGFSGKVEGYDQLMSALVGAGRVRPGDAGLARIALAMMAKAGPDGRPEIATSLTIQDGQVFLGPAKLGKAPRIAWQ